MKRILLSQNAGSCKKLCESGEEDVVAERSSDKNFNDLHELAQLEIFNYLDGKTLMKCSLVCKS